MPPFSSEVVKCPALTIIPRQDTKEICGHIWVSLIVPKSMMLETYRCKILLYIVPSGLLCFYMMCDSLEARSAANTGRSDHIILKDAGFRVEYKTNPAVRDKITNLNRCLTLGLIKIHPRCKKLIRDLKQLTWDKHGNLNQKTDPSLSHLVDSLAYLCWRLYPLTGTIKAPVGSQRR